MTFNEGDIVLISRGNSSWIGQEVVIKQLFSTFAIVTVTLKPRLEQLKGILDTCETVVDLIDLDPVVKTAMKSNKEWADIWDKNSK